jgi:hypothetical protein
MISLSIDTTKIEPARLKEGKKGARYLDAVLIPTPQSPYGNDFMIVQSVSKEERDQGVRGPIIGNAKHLERRGPGPGDPPKAQPDPEPGEPGDDVPF